MPNQTTNYNLTKPTPDEFYDIAVQNSNMDKIDSQMKAMDQKVAPTKASIVDADTVPVNDSADSFNLKKITWANVKSALVSLFAPASHAAQHASGGSDPITPEAIGAVKRVTVTTAVDFNTLYEDAKVVIYRISVTGNTNAPASAFGVLTSFGSGNKHQFFTANDGAGVWTRQGTGTWVRIYDQSFKPTAADVGASAVGHTHAAGDITSGTMTVGRGGTGKTSWTVNNLIYPSAASTLAQLGFPSVAGSVLRQGTSGAPYWTSIADLFTALGAAKAPVEYTVSVPITSWTAYASGGYYKKITVTGVLAADKPFADVSLGTDAAANELYLKSWANVTRIVPSANEVTIYTKKVPTTAYTLRLVVIR